MLMPRSTCLCVPYHVYAQIYTFVCSMPCSCLQIYMLVAILCASKAFLYLVIPFSSCVLVLQVGYRSRSCGLGLHPYVQPYIKGFGSFSLCMSVLACFYTSCFPGKILTLPCFFPFVGLSLSVFGATCLCGCICPSYGLFRCDHL